MTGHTITWYIENDYYLTAKFACTEDETADCHLDAVCDCEGWVVEHDEAGPFHMGDYDTDGERTISQRHVMMPASTCNIVTWLEETGGIDCHDGVEEAVRAADAPIKVTWNGDGYTWRYA